MRTFKAETTGLAVCVALAVGAIAGAFAAAEPVIQTPQVCRDALAAAAALDVAQTNLLSAVRVRGDAVGLEAYQDADDEVTQLLDEMADREAAYVAASTSCTGPDQ
jgi:hypothetical protein